MRECPPLVDTLKGKQPHRFSLELVCTRRLAWEQPVDAWLAFIPDALIRRHREQLDPPVFGGRREKLSMEVHVGSWDACRDSGPDRSSMPAEPSASWVRVARTPNNSTATRHPRLDHALGDKLLLQFLAVGVREGVVECKAHGLCRDEGVLERQLQDVSRRDVVRRLSQPARTMVSARPTSSAPVAAHVAHDIPLPVLRYAGDTH